MLPFKLVYHDRYDLHLGTHVFPSIKYRLVRDTLLSEKLAQPEDFLRPEPATDDDVLRVHSQEWVRKLKTGKLTASELMRLEIPYSKETIEAFWLAAGGSILAAQRALADGFAANIGGRFPPALPRQGEGLCAIEHRALANCRLPSRRGLRTATGAGTQAPSGHRH